MCRILWCATLLGASVLAGVAALHASSQPDGPGLASPAGLHGLLDLHRSHQAPCDLAAAIHAHMTRLHDELNLTDAQQEAVHELFRARHSEIAAAVRPVVEAKRTLINAIHADAPDEAAIRAAGESVGRTVSDASVVLARFKTDVLRTVELTPEQTRKLAELRANFDAAIGRLLDSLASAAENPR